MYPRALSGIRPVLVGLILGLLVVPTGAWGLGGKHRTMSARQRKTVLGAIKSIGKRSTAAKSVKTLRRELDNDKISELSPAEAIELVSKFRSAAHTLVKDLGKRGKVPAQEHREALQEVIEVWGDRFVGAGGAGGADKFLRHKVEQWKEKQGDRTKAGREVNKFDTYALGMPLFSFAEKDITRFDQALYAEAGQNPLGEDVAPEGILEVVGLYMGSSDTVETAQERRDKLQLAFATAHKRKTREAFDVHLGQLEKEISEALKAERRERGALIGSVEKRIDTIVQYGNDKRDVLADTGATRDGLRRVAAVLHQAALLHLGHENLERLARVHEQLTEVHRGGSNLPALAVDPTTPDDFAKHIAKAGELHAADPLNERAPRGWWEEATGAYEQYLDVVMGDGQAADAGGGETDPKRAMLDMARARRDRRRQTVEEVDAALAAMKYAATRSSDSGALGQAAKDLQEAIARRSQSDGHGEPGANGDPRSNVARLTRRTRESLHDRAMTVLFDVVNDDGFEHDDVAEVLDAYSNLSDATRIIFERKDVRPKGLQRKLFANLYGVAERSNPDPQVVRLDEETEGWVRRAEKMVALFAVSHEAKKNRERSAREFEKPAHDKVALIVAKARKKGRKAYLIAKKPAQKKIKRLGKRLRTPLPIWRITYEEFEKLLSDAASQQHSEIAGWRFGTMDRGADEFLLRQEDYVKLADEVIKPTLSKLLRNSKPWNKLARIEELVSGLRKLVEDKPVALDPELGADEELPTYGVSELNDKADRKHKTIEAHLKQVGTKLASRRDYENFGQGELDGGLPHTGLMRVAELYDQATGRHGAKSLIRAMANRRADAVRLFVQAKIGEIAEAIDRQGQNPSKAMRLLGKAQRAWDAAEAAIEYATMAGVFKETVTVEQRKQLRQLTIENSKLFGDAGPLSLGDALEKAQERLMAIQSTEQEAGVDKTQL